MLTKCFPRSKLQVSKGGGYIYEILISLGLTLIVYKMISEYIAEKKTKRIKVNFVKIQSNKDFNNLPIFLRNYLLHIQDILSKLDYPYKLTFRNYLIIKYILSIVFFSISIINNNNIFVSIIVSCLVFYIPNLLISMYKQNEKVLIIKELRNIVNAINISLSASLTLEDAIKSSVNVITYKRLRNAYEQFIINYKISSYNIRKSMNLLKEKFSYYEMELFVSTLINSEREGDIIQCLEKYNMILDISYSKYLAKENSKRLLYLTFGTIISLINIIIIVMYPLFVEMVANLQTIFS